MDEPGKFLLKEKMLDNLHLCLKLVTLVSWVQWDEFFLELWVSQVRTH